jgi:hypothetical protein
MDISKHNREPKKTRYVRKDRPNTRLQNKAIKALMDAPDPVIAADNAGIELDILLTWLKDLHIPRESCHRFHGKVATHAM